jgi:hypothetical protein
MHLLNYLKEIDCFISDDEVEVVVVPLQLGVVASGGDLGLLLGYLESGVVVVSHALHVLPELSDARPVLALLSLALPAAIEN